MNGLWLVAVGLKAAGFVLALAGVMLIALQIGQGRHPGPLHRRLEGLWRTAATVGWGGLARRAAGRLVDTASRTVATGFERADRGPFVDAVFVGLMFVVLPLLAFLNVAVGGRPNLAFVYIAVFVVLAVFNFTAECRALGPFNRAASLFLGLALYFVVPAYVLRAFADRLLHESVGNAFFESLLVAPLVFILAYSAMTFVEGPEDGRDGGARSAREAFKPMAHAFLAALPVTFVLVFAALLAGHLAVADPSPTRSWPLLVSTMVLAATGFAATRALLAAALGSPRPGALAAACVAGLAAAAGLSAAAMVFAYGPAPGPLTAGEVLNVLGGRSRDGSGLYLGPEFWVTHLPFVPMLAVLGGICAAWLAKIMAVLLAHRAGAPGWPPRPFTVSGLYCAVLAVLAAAGAAWMGP